MFISQSPITADLPQQESPIKRTQLPNNVSVGLLQNVYVNCKIKKYLI